MKNDGSKGKKKSEAPGFRYFAGVILLAAALAAISLFAGTLVYSILSRHTQSILSTTTFFCICTVSLLIITAAVILNSVFAESRRAKERKKAADTSNAPRFYRLTETDREMSKYIAPAFDDTVTLEALCEGFRNYAASRLGLYYDIKTMRSFVAGLCVSRLIIMQGISGTGKTSLAYAFGKFLQNDSTVVSVQPSWKERSDLLGYFNEFTKTFNETELLRKIYEAGYTDEVYVTVLDEMNIARIEYYFAEFLSLLELPSYDEWNINIISDSRADDPKCLSGGKLRVPRNMWYVGTANNDDSTMSISDKVYDRAMVIDLDSRAQPFEAPDTPPVCISCEHFLKLSDDAKKERSVTSDSLKKIAAVDKFLIDNFGITFGNRIMRQILEYVPVYIACGGTETEAVDILISKKVLRKLDAKNPIYIKTAAAELSAYLDSLFGEGRMVLCRRYLAKYEKIN